MKIIQSIPICGVILLALIGVPSFAQSDLTGIWANRGHMDWLDHGRGPDLVDYSGIPINDAARAKALSYTAALQAEQERQCEYYTPAYVVFGPFGLNIWNEVDPATSRIVADLGERVWDGLAATPDGRTVLFTRIDNVSNDIMMVDNFR